MINYYDVLGVPTNSTPQEIKRQFRRRAKEIHPDVRPEDGGAAGEMRLLLAAYETLGDRNRRLEYDRSLGAVAAERGFDYREFLRSRHDDPVSQARLVFHDLLTDRADEALEVYERLAFGGRVPARAAPVARGRHGRGLPAGRGVRGAGAPAGGWRPVHPAVPARARTAVLPALHRRGHRAPAHAHLLPDGVEPPAIRAHRAARRADRARLLPAGHGGVLQEDGRGVVRAGTQRPGNAFAREGATMSTGSCPGSRSSWSASGTPSLDSRASPAL